MKLIGPAAARFVAARDENIGGVLVFGADHGLARDYARQLLQGSETTELTADQIQHDSALLHDSAYGGSLFGGATPVFIRGAGERALPALEEVLAKSDAARSLIVVEAGELTSKSKLRQFFETHAHLAAINCLAETGEALAKTIQRLAAVQGAKFAPEALDYVTGRLPPDRLAQLQELDKLLLYVGAFDKKDVTITLRDALATIGDAAEQDVYELPWLVFGSESAATDRALTRLAEEGTSEIQILRGLVSHALKLHQVQSLVDSGHTQGQAMGAIRPPLYDRDRARLSQQLRRWRLPAATRAVSALNEAERLMKSTGYPSGPLLGQLCLQLSQV